MLGDRRQEIGDRRQTTGCHGLLASPCVSGSLGSALADEQPVAPIAKHVLNAQASRSSRRRGVTLLEVLISIGVVAVGLLGVAALIPIGSFAVNETAKADRSATLGRAGMHEVRTRQMLQRMRDDGTARWCLAQSGVALDDNQTVPALPPNDAKSIRQQYLIGQPFAIDPLFATEAALQSNPGNINYFPYYVGVGNPNDSRLTRLRLDMFTHNLLRMTIPAVPTYYCLMSASDRLNYSTRQFPVVNRIFTWRDDLIFDVDADNPDRRPRQSCYWRDFNMTEAVAPVPVMSGYGESTPAGSQLFAQAADQYTWMLTAVPDPNELPNTDPTMPLGDRINILTAHKQKTYEVSIVTFYKRDMTCDATATAPSERFVEIEFQGTGIGGGDALLMVQTTTMSQEEATDYLKVNEDEWIMVTGFVREPRLDPIFDLIMAGTDNGFRRIAKWYRVIRVDDEIDPNIYHSIITNQDYYVRNVTLAGPDWDSSVWDDTIYMNGSYINNQPRATIIDGAIGVYKTTVTLE